MDGKVRNGSYIFGKQGDGEKKSVLKYCGGSLILHIILMLIFCNSLLFTRAPKVEFPPPAITVKLGEERDKKLLPRITKPKAAPKTEKKEEKIEPKKEVKPAEKKAEKTPEGKPNSLKPQEKKPEKAKTDTVPKEEKKKSTSLDELLSGEVLDKIKKDARAEETNEGMKDGDADGDVTDPALAMKANLYIRTISKKIRENWNIPSIISAEERKNLVASIFFKITYTGELFDIKVTASSGNRVFDNSVIEAVKKTGRLPLPDDKNLKKLVLKEGFECPFTSE